MIDERKVLDVKRSIELFVKYGRHIMGFIENMPYFQPDKSREKINIFDREGGEILSREKGLRLLGAIPIDLEIGRGGDSGVPLMVSYPSSDAASVFKNVAGKIISRTEG